ncbi:methyl-accepting chemotaxis protein [Geobacter sp. FeAm09]|uniref:methyl-accepting chemotaxis protein n=1 Tax=Geobacter sp. FeAm09 TaxID=2597769 RepID=UPI0011ECCB99|nr:methyl-accepting chemotaxis protein [Geobacter sp. FeAm09]QEM69077.1 methyl-accepting chemotaxis protein [Geobacter sp. FeAm09]
MSFWADLKVRTKQLVLIGICCLAMLVVGGVGMLDMKKLNTHLGASNENLRQVAILGEMKNSFLTMRLMLLANGLTKEPAKIRERLVDFGKTTASIREKIKALEATSLTPEGKEKLDTFKKGFELYASTGQKSGETTAAAIESQDPNAIDAANKWGLQNLAPLYAKPAEAISLLVESQVKSSQISYETDQSIYRRDVLLMMVIIFLAVTASFTIGLFISRSITGPLGRVFTTMSKVAAGDLTAHSDVDSRDEMGLLSTEVNTMSAKLQGIITQVAQSAVRVASSSGHLQSTSDQIATGAEEVASQTGTVATASEEMAATSSDIARNCLSAAESSSFASDTARSGAAVVQETITGMERIAGRVKQAAKTVEELGARSDQIGAIIGTIEDIADQTNLLALNAAIEAARAGDQGRGFAVVADEVRALAERTTRATREIGEMIKAIQTETKGAVNAMEEGVSEVEKGTASSMKSGEALQGILNQVNELTMQVNQIATAAEEQTATTGEITVNIHQITDVVHQTAKGATETATAAADLARQAEELQRLVGQFKLA